MNQKTESITNKLKSNISFIVCSNGYGHLKRVLLIAKSILKENQDLNINMFCKEQLISFAKEEINFANPERIDFSTNATSQEISWLVKDGITKKKYKAWQEEMAGNKKLKESNLIISDNHLLPLRCFDNVLLMGSFLWHDVAKQTDQEIAAIIESEIKLLKEKKPSMICLEAMAMPNVLKQTNAITVPWMTQPYASHYQCHTERKHILITGGGTALINNKLASVAFELATQNPEWFVYLDTNLFELTKKENNGQLRKFNFAQEDFALLDVIVCRPGIGILTDCAQYGIPVFAIGDGSNPEITHNAARVQEMGIGIGIDLMEQDSHITAGTVESLVKNSETLNNCRKQWRKQSTGGAEVAAIEILSYMSKIETK